MSVKRFVRNNTGGAAQNDNGMSASNVERILHREKLNDGRYLITAAIEEALTFAADAAKNLTTQVPANAIIEFAQLNYDTAIVLATAVKVGLGTAASPSLYALSGTAVIKNTKTDAALGNTTVAVATTLQIGACATGGTAAGTITSGTIRARVIYKYITSIKDAA